MHYKLVKFPTVVFFHEKNLIYFSW